MSDTPTITITDTSAFSKALHAVSTATAGWTERLRFRTYGGEFTRVLEAVGLFQASPRDYDVWAAVRCFARHDGLTMLAINGASGAVGNIALEDQEGVGMFSLPHAQVRAILAVFKRRLPKDAKADQYVLEVTVTDRWIKIHDISELFDGDEYVISLPDPRDREVHEEPESELVMRTAATAFTALRSRDTLDLAGGVYFSQPEIARIARAAKLIGGEVMLRPRGRHLLAPLSDDFAAWTLAATRDDEDHEPPHIDERAVTSWSARLSEIVESGAL